MDLRQFALCGYYYASLPLRGRFRARLEAMGQAPLCVLFYHRVADNHPNPWSISNEQFEHQIDWLRERAEFLSLAEIQSRMAAGRNDRLAVSITFDDGYAENCDRAIPYLIDQGIPVTYFASLDFVVNQRPFQHDVERGRPLPVNTPEQLQRMADAGVEIGSHTRNHRDIGAISEPAELVDELITASDELGDLIGRPIRYFAFPYGLSNNLSLAAVQLAKDHGFKGVCSAYGAYNFPGSDPFHIQRFHADPEMIRLKNWATVDRRKIGCGRGYQFPESAVTTEALQRYLRDEQLGPQVVHPM